MLFCFVLFCFFFFFFVRSLPGNSPKLLRESFSLKISLSLLFRVFESLFLTPAKLFEKPVYSSVAKIKAARRLQQWAGPLKMSQSTDILWPRSIGCKCTGGLHRFHSTTRRKRISAYQVLLDCSTWCIVAGVLYFQLDDGFKCTAIALCQGEHERQQMLVRS